MPGRINRSVLNNEISKTKLKALEKQASIIANEILEQRKKEYIDEISAHPISREISAGPNSENISNTLNGDGNLYSFIGFDAGDKPIEDLINIIEKNTKIKKIDSKKETFDFEVFSPSLEELRGYTPMPFEGGNSWLKGIEKGISGFSNYLFGLLFPTSRSGKAIQTKDKIRRASYKPTKYFSVLYRNFVESFK